MRAVNDHIAGTSPIMIAFMVGTSMLSIVGLGILLYTEAPHDFAWSTMSSDYKVLLAVFFLILFMMTGLCWMMLNLSITMKADSHAIKARIFPFMRSYREILLTDIVKMKVIDFSGGLSLYGGVGYKKSLGGRTSYTLHFGGHALVLYLEGKKELHVEISKIDEWKRYVEAFENRNL